MQRDDCLKCDGQNYKYEMNYYTVWCQISIHDAILLYIYFVIVFCRYPVSVSGIRHWRLIQALKINWSSIGTRQNTYFSDKSFILAKYHFQVTLRWYYELLQQNESRIWANLTTGLRKFEWLHMPISKPRLRIWLRLAWPQGCFDICACFSAQGFRRQDGG